MHQVRRFPAGAHAMRIRGAIVPTPRQDAYDPADIGTDEDVQSVLPLSGDVRAWQKLSAPLFERLRRGSMTLRQIRKWAATQKPRNTVKLTEECLFWLCLRGRVVADIVRRRRVWRVA